MSIFDKFRKKIKKKPEKPEKKPVRGPTSEKAKKIKKRESNLAYRVLRSPYITEKSAELAKRGQYTFKVFDNANKSEIKQAISEIYGVNVERVRIIKEPSKKKRLGRREGRKPGFKKAIVKTKEGQKIEAFPH